MKRTVLLIGVASLFAVPSTTRQAGDWVPGSRYDPAVPTIRQVLGFDPPARFTSFYETEKLLHAWAAAAPERCRLIRYGEDYEGKSLYLLAVSSPEHIANLDTIRARLAKLADPRTLGGPAELDEIVRTTPATVLISTIDTSEASSVEAMQILAYQLLAGVDPLTEQIRRNVVTYIVPVENPSARERYVAWYTSVQSALPKADPQAAEHDDPWSVGDDANHYLLDPNRDYVSMLLVESRAKARLMRQWWPEVALDVHEMGVDSPFFFPPYPEPYNRNLPIDMLKKWWNLYAAALREDFDRHGWRYFSGDAFGSPFLGMHTLYTQYLGAVGILCEQAAGSGGLVIERANGSLLTLRERVQHHVTGAMTLLRVTAERREERHRDFHEFFRSSLAGVPGFAQKRYVFVPGADPNATADFIDKLLAHGIEVHRALAPFASARAYDYDGRGPISQQFPAGSYVVSLAQPLSRLANALLEKEPYHSIPFFYDVSVWALPYNYGIEGYWTEDERPVRLERVAAPGEARGRLVGGPAKVAYAWEYRGNREARAAFALATEGFNLYLHPGHFTQGGHLFGPSVLAFVAENDAPWLHDRIGRLVAEDPIEVYALDSSHTEDGSDLGSPAVFPITRPSVAVLTRDGVDLNAFGSFWFFFDALYRLPFTPLTTERLKTADLRRYSVIILPDGGERLGRGGLTGRPYAAYLGEEGAAHLRRWVEDGGTLVTIKGGTAWASAQSQLVDVESLGLTAATPGAVVRVRVRRSTPLTVGFPETFTVLARNARVFRARGSASSLVSYELEGLKVAGYLTEEDARRLSGSDYLMTQRLGRGRVVLFAEDPNLRCQWPVLHRLLFNAILFAPAVR